MQAKGIDMRYATLDASLLHCPHCVGGGWLHHTAAHIFTRDKECGPSTHFTISHTHDEAVNPNDDWKDYGADLDMRIAQPDSNPSKRGAVVIGFWCEECHEKSELVIEQHKGQTMLYWWGKEEKLKVDDD